MQAGKVRTAPHTGSVSETAPLNKAAVASPVLETSAKDNDRFSCELSREDRSFTLRRKFSGFSSRQDTRFDEKSTRPGRLSDSSGSLGIKNWFCQPVKRSGKQWRSNLIVGRDTASCRKYIANYSVKFDKAHHRYCYSRAGRSYNRNRRVVSLHQHRYALWSSGIR